MTANYHPDHRADLARSGLSEDDARAAGLYSARPCDIPRLIGRDVPDGTSGLVFPYRGCDGFVRVKAFLWPKRPRLRVGSTTSRFRLRNGGS